MSIARFWQVERVDAGRFSATLGEDWYQGRGVYGGLVAALLSRAMTDALGAPDKPLRTVHLSFAAPATAGEVEIDVEPLRVGRSVGVLRGRMRRGETVIAAGQGTFAADRPVDFGFEQSLAPPFPPAETVPDGPPALYIPEFCRYFEFRQCEGPASFSGGMRAHLGGWCRPREATPMCAELVLALLDSWAPAALCRRAEWAPAASVDLSADLPARFDGVADDELCMYMADSRVARGGYADERAALWSAQGKWLGRARQLIALFDPPTEGDGGGHAGRGG